MMKFAKRFWSLLLCAALLIGYMPLFPQVSAVAVAREAVVGTVTDPGTANAWETMMGTDADGNRYAGRMWVDKSVYKDGDTAVLNSKGGAGSSFQVELDQDEAFQIVFSALGSTMTTTSTVSSTGPLDVVLILDNSVSMNTTSGGTTRMQKVIEAANSMLEVLLQGKQDVRLGIVAYAEDASTVLPFGDYENGVVLKVNSYTGTGNRNGVISAYTGAGQRINNSYQSAGYANYTNTQAGFAVGMEMLAQAQGTANRKPVVILLTDGAANTAKDALFNKNNATVRQVYHASDIDPMIALSTLLGNAYNKALVSEKYGKSPMVYGVGVDLSATDGSNAIINPKDNFSSQNRNANIVTAYNTYINTWAKGQNVSYRSGSYTFNFGHQYADAAITDADITSNISYVDTYYPVAAADVSDVFDQIYQELSSGVFNPISSSTTNAGGTGVDDTPLIYVDFIGQHMEIKEMQSVTLFGASYGIVKNADGTYSVTRATGINPTTNESWNTAEDIKIQVIPQADGTQKLEIRINQEILPIILEKVDTETVGNESSATITEFMQDPLRIYYTVGLASDILLPNGEVDVSKLQGYPYMDDATGTVSFYSNRFGVMNQANAGGIVTMGDAHVGFQPSPANRFYYHQANQGIFTKITDKRGNPVTIPENNQYGILWNEDSYDLTWMSYEEYLNMQPDSKVYTYVTYFRPTAGRTNAAEEVTYLVYTEWKYLKESVAFYDANTGTYLNNGQVATAADVSAYLQSNGAAQLYAVLGVGSRRTSRLHNMMVDKLTNATGTATESYTPQYLENKAEHNDNDVVVWLGNNGKMTVQIDTGIALTKAVTESFGNAEDVYDLTVTIPADVVADPVVVDENGTVVASTYSGNVLTVPLKAGQTVYINGIPGGTQCRIGEILTGDYYIASQTETVTVPLVSEVLSGSAQYATATVTNAPYKYGNLFITKEITSDHAVPESVLATPFEITVALDQALAGKTFTVEDSANAEPYQVTVDENGKLVFQLLARQTVEIFALPEGTAVTVTETTPDSHFAVSYRTRNHSGETADSDNSLVIPAGGSATAVVLNHYTPAPTSVDLDVTIHKTFADAAAAAFLEGGTFTFQVQKYNSAGYWEDLTATSISYEAGQYGEKSLTLENLLANEVYTQVGTYSYKIFEQKGEVTNVSYDRAVYTIDVVVTDVGGQLVAQVIGANNAIIDNQSGDEALDYLINFTNTYETAPISIDIRKLLVNNSGDSTISAAGFRFLYTAVDAEGNPLEGYVSPVIYSDAAGEARISGVYTRDMIGTHYYIISEENTGKAGWFYSQAKYLVTVLVEEDENGKLTASMTIAAHNDAAAAETAYTVSDGNKGKVYFTNTYDPTDVAVDLNGFVQKQLTGKTLVADQFAFHVYRDGDRSSPVLTGTNDANGQVTFGSSLTFSSAGKYQYDIVERIPTGAVYEAATGTYLLDGMHYDGTIYDLVVEVTNDADSGKLVVSYYFEDAPANVVTFHNRYETTATRYSLTGTKILHGRAPRSGEFRFRLYQGETLLQTVSNKADGSFTFDAITYNQPGTYTYTIQEVAGDIAGVRYDGVDHPVTVTVTVTDNGRGALVASADKNSEAIRFENTYTASSALVSFVGTKTLEGGQLTDGSFNFLLYATNNSFDVGSGSLVAAAQNENGTFALGRSFAEPGTYYYAIVEDGSAPMADVVYDRTQHNFMVRVTDTGDGQLRAQITNMNTGAVSETAASVAASLGFTNATFAEATLKEVYKSGQETTIDGKKVNAGDILTYFITYTNYTGENVVADIMDTIPAHTSYVEGSASHGGTYAGSHVNWVLNVPKGQQVTVSFNVRVDETEVIVANTAVVRDGVNTYSTNQVVNHTLERSLNKDVFAAEDPATSIDGQKVYEGDELLYRLTFTNVAGKTVNATIADKIPENATYVEDSADNGGTFADGVLTWNLENIPAWFSVTVSFRVTVNAEVGATTIDNQATATDGESVFESQWVSNYTVADLVEKNVYFAADATTGIDGKKVKAGDTLIYAITYHNTAKEAATVTITDTIPEYTTYVEGSADNEGLFEEGKLTWVKTLEAQESVTVTFRVTVTDAGSVTITNQAQIQEGKNTYTTNQVSNPIQVPEAPRTPQTGDNSRMNLWITLLVLSGGGILTLTIFDKKKEKQQ